MTATQKKMIDESENLLNTIDGIEAAKGYLRYETIRKLNFFQIENIFIRNLKGKNFDEMIDRLTLERLESGQSKLISEGFKELPKSK